MTIRPFADIEIALVAYLSSQFPLASVCTELPAAFGVPTIHIQKVGGSNADPVLSHPVVDVDVYAATRGEAFSLSLQVENLIQYDLMTRTDLPGAVVTGGRVDISPRWLPYDDTSKRRVSGMYTIHCRAK